MEEGKMGRRIVDSTGGRDLRRDDDPLAQYWDRLKNLIPAEVSAIYIAGSGIIPEGEKIGLLVWALFCLGCTILFIAKATKTVEGKPKETFPIDWAHVVISSISFIVWVYALGGPFVGLGIHIAWIGTLLMIGWTSLVPYFYHGKKL
jgi:hypothetical protein